MRGRRRWVTAADMMGKIRRGRAGIREEEGVWGNISSYVYRDQGLGSWSSIRGDILCDTAVSRTPW